MRQQAAGAAGIFIKDIPLLIWADVHAFQDDLTIINICPGILQVDPAGTQAFDLGADQFNAGFQRFDDKILVVRFTVLGNHLLPGFSCAIKRTSFQSRFPLQHASPFR